ncbi:MAG TPA: penicillin acylase family protein [Gemmatimonadales bacterium]
MDGKTLLRLVLSLFGLAALLYVGARQMGPVPPLGPFLHPLTGVWAVAEQDEVPAGETLVIPGMIDSVQVVFDGRAVPHIFATNVEDAYRALGYVVARFRLFQLDVQARATAGELTALVGARALGFDRRQRRLGLAWSAEREFANFDSSSPAGRAIVAYGEGINARIGELTPSDLPLEYRLLHAAPRRWETLYSFYLAKQMGYTLSFSNSDRSFERLAERVGPLAAAALAPSSSPIQQPVVPTGLPVPRFDRSPIPAAARAGASTGSGATGARLATLDWNGSRGASNAWAVGPSRSANGLALLAADPHLDLSLPSVWFEAHLVVPGALDVYGVTFPGAPFVAIGFNRDVAWSFTASYADVIDFYEETFDNPSRPASYLLDGTWLPLQRRVERFRDRSGGVVATDTVHFTHRGPVLIEDGRALSMRWTVLEQQRALQVLHDLAAAGSVTAWATALAGMRAPPITGMAADRAGGIAAFAPGAYPIRPGDGNGQIIFDGSSSANDWLGYRAVTEYPFARNPSQGFLASANQQQVDPLLDPEYQGAAWPAPWRALRINQLLHDASPLTPETMIAFQTDPGSARADQFVPYFLDAASRWSPPDATAGANATAGAAILSAWDRRYTRDNQAAVLFELAMRRLDARTWDELRAGDSASRRVYTPDDDVLYRLLQTPGSPWWDDRDTPDLETRDQIIASSLAAAYEEAVVRYGPPGAGWRWDGERVANIYHPLGLASLSALGLKVQGGPSTLNPISRTGTHGPSWRMVVEMGPEVRAWGVYPGGQSGSPASRWYRDRLDRWTAGTLDPLPFPHTPEALAPEQVMARVTLRGREP